MGLRKGEAGRCRRFVQGFPITGRYSRLQVKREGLVNAELTSFVGFDIGVHLGR